MKYYYTTSELYHHGVKGQKWGVRQWQNPDGSLTPAGREHYGYSTISAQYKTGLRDATIRGGLIGRSKYQKEHAKEREHYNQEKQFLKSAKKIRKKEAYRDQLVRANEKQIRRNQQYADNLKAENKDLRKYGADSDTYKKFVYSQQSSYYGDSWGELIGTVAANAMTSSYYKKHADVEIRKLIDRNNTNAKRAMDRGKRYAQSNEQLMNLPINTLTKKKDIRRSAKVNG